MKISIIVILAVAAAVFSSACASEENPTDVIGSHDKTREFLNGVPLSEPLRRPVSRIPCDAEEASDLYLNEIDLSVKTAGVLWENCLKIYACSRSAREFLETGFDGDGSFRLGFEDLSKIKTKDTPEKLGGIYLTGTDQIYIDTSLKAAKESCPILLHEVVHRFDPLAKNGEESLKTEFRAYWYQIAFLQDLFLRTDRLGYVLRDDPLKSYGFTRKTLLEAIARVYRFTPDYSISESYKPLPTEAKGLKPSLDPPVLLSPRF